jgi:hypothetical protein
MTKSCSRKSNNFKVKQSETIWNLYQDRVFQEIANLLCVEDTTTSTPGWFPMQLPAIKHVFENMTEEEKAVLHAKQEKMMQEGYTEQTKRR